MKDISAKNRMFIFKLLNLEVNQWPNFKHLLSHNKNDIEKTYKTLKALRSASNKINRSK